MTWRELTPLESKVMEWLLDGSHSLLHTLRVQLQHARIVSREYSGTGFFTGFSIPEGVARVPGPPSRVVLGDVFANVPSVEGPINFLLFIDDGMLNTLEGFTFDDAWPEDVKGFELCYAVRGCSPSASHVDLYYEDDGRKDVFEELNALIR